MFLQCKSTHPPTLSYARDLIPIYRLQSKQPYITLRIVAQSTFATPSTSSAYIWLISKFSLNVYTSRSMIFTS